MSELLIRDVMTTFSNMNALELAELLEPLKGGKIPVELLVTTKDPESKTKAFEKCVEVIKGAGVSIFVERRHVGNDLLISPQ